MSVGITTFGMFSPQIDYDENSYGGGYYFEERKRKPVIIVDQVIQEEKEIRINIDGVEVD